MTTQYYESPEYKTKIKARIAELFKGGLSRTEITNTLIGENFKSFSGEVITYAFVSNRLQGGILKSLGLKKRKYTRSTTTVVRSVKSESNDTIKALQTILTLNNVNANTKLKMVQAIIA